MATSTTETTSDIAKPNRSLPVLGSAPLTDDGNSPQGQTAANGGQWGTPHTASRDRRLRRVSSCPPNIPAPSPWAVWDHEHPSIDWKRFMSLDTSADDSALIGAPVPLPDIDPSMLLLDPLGNGVFDAGELQQQKEDATREASVASSSTKRKRASSTIIACHHCGVDDTPKWRPGPDGPGTLCNVCGLLYARGERSKHSARGTRPG